MKVAPGRQQTRIAEAFHNPRPRFRVARCPGAATFELVGRQRADSLQQRVRVDLCRWRRDLSSEAADNENRQASANAQVRNNKDTSLI